MVTATLNNLPDEVLRVPVTSYVKSLLMSYGSIEDSDIEILSVGNDIIFSTTRKTGFLPGGTEYEFVTNESIVTPREKTLYTSYQARYELGGNYGNDAFTASHKIDEIGGLELTYPSYFCLPDHSLVSFYYPGVLALNSDGYVLVFPYIKVRCRWRQANYTSDRWILLFKHVFLYGAHFETNGIHQISSVGGYSLIRYPTNSPVVFNTSVDGSVGGGRGLLPVSTNYSLNGDIAYNNDPTGQFVVNYPIREIYKCFGSFLFADNLTEIRNLMSLSEEERDSQKINIQWEEQYLQENPYHQGGTSVSSGLPQGGFDNTFGPNTSGLIPGLNSAGQSTGQGGAVGNDISLSGMYTKYLMNQQYLNTLAQFFWEDNIGIQALKLAFGNPIDSIISLISYPFNLDLLVPTVQQNIFFGKYDSLFAARAISRSSFQIDWGTIPIDFYWGNFLDYAPYTQVQLYLPWGVGFVSIDPNEVMPYSNVPNDFNPVNYNKGSIRVVTNIELDKGACVHNVIGNRGLIIGSYGGVVGKQIPMTALDNSAKMLALLGAASGVGMAAANAMAGAATGKYTSVTPKYSTVGYGGNNWVQSLGFEHKFEGGQMLSDMGGSKAMKAGLASAAALASTPPNYPRAGTFSDATNTMCAQVPYIIISRPSQSVPQNYGHYNGYPSNIYYNYLSMVSGYTEISEIHLDNVPASVEELEELDSMLKGGVLL